MGINDVVLVYYPLAKVQLRGTDRLHCAKSTRTLTAAGRRPNEGVIRWNNILRNLASQNAGRMILMDIEHELRAMDQARLTTDGIHFDSIEGQACLN